MKARRAVDFVQNDSDEDRLYGGRRLRSGGEEWEHVCLARHRHWTLSLLAGRLRRWLCCGGTRIIDKRSLEKASHQLLRSAPPSSGRRS